jgi:aspartate/glutamate racemase
MKIPFIQSIYNIWRFLMGKLLVVGGGVGPAAGNATQAKIIEQTDNHGTDQGHANLLQTSVSSFIMDRTKWLNRNKPGHEKDLELAKQLGNPGIAQANIINNSLAGWMQIKDTQAVIGVPCNTFHSQEVWDAFEKNLKNRDRLNVVHMINETAEAIIRAFPNEYKNKTLLVGLLSTSGTRDTGVYGDVMKKKGIRLRLLDGDPGSNGYDSTPQGQVMDAIYNSAWGIKGSRPDYQKALNIIEVAIQGLRTQTKEYPQAPNAFILGCTELPLPYKELNKPVPHNYIDPVEVLVKRMIILGGYSLKNSIPVSSHVHEPPKQTESKPASNTPKSYPPNTTSNRSKL